MRVVCACRLMLKRDTFIDKDLMMNILMNIDEWDGTMPMPCILKPKPLWAGKQVRRAPLPALLSFACSLGAALGRG